MALSAFRTKKIIRVFSAYDVNNDGLITRGDLLALLAYFMDSAGLDPESMAYKDLARDVINEDWHRLRMSADLNDDGQITQPEFLALVDNETADPEGYEGMLEWAVNRLVALVDVDGDGAITLEEYAHCFKGFGLSEREIAASFDDLDRNASDSVTRVEVREALRNFMLSEDPNATGTLMFGPLDG